MRLTLLCVGRGGNVGRTSRCVKYRQRRVATCCRVAERLWTPLNGGAATAANLTAQTRLAHFRCLLIQRGIAASPLGMTIQHYDTSAGETQTQPGAFSGLPPRPGSCLQGGVNRSTLSLLH